VVSEYTSDFIAAASNLLQNRFMVRVDTEFRLCIYYIGGNDRINAVSSPI